MAAYPPEKEDNMSDILATADFKVTGTSSITGKEVDTTVHFELYKSGAFDYGNGTGMSMEWENGNEFCYDTRYEPVTADNFKEFALQFLRSYIQSTLRAEPIN